MFKAHTHPNDDTKAAERAEADRAHTADREATPDEQDRADQATSELSEHERARVSEREREMAERGAHQKGEGKLD